MSEILRRDAADLASLRSLGHTALADAFVSAATMLDHLQSQQFEQPDPAQSQDEDWDIRYRRALNAYSRAVDAIRTIAGFSGFLSELNAEV